MIMSTTNVIEGMAIVKTLGVVDTKSTMFASNAANSARNNLEAEAEQIGGNAIIGYRVDADPMTGRAHAYGTVVVVKGIRGDSKSGNAVIIADACATALKAHVAKTTR